MSKERNNILVPINNAARLLGISPTTLRRIEKDNEVKGYGLRVYYTPGGQRRYSTSEIEQFFLNKGFSGKIGFGKKPVLLVVDCNTLFTTKKNSPLYGEWSKEVEQIAQLVNTAHQTNCPVVFSHSCYQENDPGLEIYAKKIPAMLSLEREIDDVELDGHIKEKKSDMHIMYKYLSVYYQTELLEILTSHSCDTLIICGFSTSGAIRAVVTETIQYGIHPIVPAEATGDRNDHVHRSNLADINTKFGDVVSVQETIRYLFGKG